MAYTLDSTKIDLCLSLFPWARFRKTKGTVKAHVLLDLRGSIPTFIEITDGSVHDVNILDHITIEYGAVYVTDRGYPDLDRLYNMDQQGAFFITRAKSNTAMTGVYSRPVNKSAGLRCDQSVRFKSFYSKKDYPQLIRRIKFIDEETSNTYIFLTNNFELDALLITQLYKERWKVELFFKWIKQHLRIKNFYGTGYNAVCCQIWIAVCTYLLVAIVKKRLVPELSLYTLLQIFSLTLFEKVPINELFTKNDDKSLSPDDDKQLKLFDL
jgi:IS4 transposase